MDPPYSGLPGSDWESCKYGPDRPSQDLGNLLSHVLGCGSSADHLRFRERIQCQECEQFMEEPCWFHAKSIPNENVVPFALASLPQMLYLDICYNSPTGKIVLAKQMISSHTIFGPMIAPTTDIFRDAYLYAFPSPHDGGTHFFQLESELFSNWMRYVRFAENPTEANLAVYLRGSQVVFVTTRMILPGEELQVCYSVKYARTVGRTVVLEDNKENIGLLEVHALPEKPLVGDASDDPGSSCSPNVSDRCSISSRCTISETLVDDDAAILETAPVVSEAALTFPEKISPSISVVGDHLINSTPLGEIVPELSDEKPSPCQPVPSVRADSPEIGCFRPVPKVSDADPCGIKSGGTSAVDIFARKQTLRSAAKTPSTLDRTTSELLCPDPVDKSKQGIGNGALRQKDLDFSQIDSDADSDWQPDGVISDEDSDSDYETRQHSTKRVCANDKAVRFRYEAVDPAITSSSSTRIEDSLPRQPFENRNLSKYPLVSVAPEQQNVAKEFSFSIRATFADDDDENGQDQDGSEGTNKRKMKKPNEEECPVCHSRFRRLNWHLRTAHADFTKLNWKSVCEICGENYPSQTTLRYHITTCHQPSGEATTGEMLETAFEYIRTTGFLSYFCQNCMKYFPSKALLDLHEFSHRVPEDHKDRKERQCPVCDFTGTSFSEVVLHTTEHSIDASGRKHCLFCPDKLTSLSQHYKLKHPEYREIVSKDWQFECEQCHMKFFSKHHLDNHFRSVHGNQQCIYCAMQFPNNHEMGRHLPEHMKDGVFPCRSCPKTFTAYFQFRAHYRRTHDVNRIHLCEICQFVCPSRVMLNNHMQSHNKDFRFVCKECGKRFHAARYLRGHVRWVHEGNLKEYKKNYLKKRKEKEHDGLVDSYVDPRRKFAFEDFPYKCHECHLGYMRRGTLMNHVKQKHPEMDPESVPL